MANFPLDKAVYDTLRYFDFFQMPLTATQIWRCLIIDLHGQADTEFTGVTLRDIQRILAESAWLKERLQTQWGYYFLHGKKDMVRERLRRHALAQDKWKVLGSIAPYLASVPFVRGILASGSLAIDNTKESSDLDLFVIAQEGRIWTSRLLLLLVCQLAGKRRKHWNILAPNKVCLNHYVTDGHLLMPPEVRNLYTAVQYALHVPVFGVGQWHSFRQANEAWISRYVLVQELPHVHHLYTVTRWPFFSWMKRMTEGFLLEPLGEMLERWAGLWQLRVIEGHRRRNRPGRIVVSSQELAFHPDTKVPSILAHF